jgi:hypothetical protein
MDTAAIRRFDRSFFSILAFTVLAVTIAGFGPSYYFKFWTHAPPLKFMVHVHAAVFTAWLALLLTQATLIRSGRFATHRTLGRFAFALVVLMVITGYIVIFGKPRPTVEMRAFIFTPMLSLVIFPALVAAAIHFRHDGATHKRLMIIATISVGTAGVTRIMLGLGLDPSNYRSQIATYLLFLLPLVAYDLITRRKLHPATGYAGLILLLRHPLHELVAYTDTWQRTAHWLTSSPGN